MESEHDYDKVSAAPDEDEVDLFVDEQAAALHYTFRHGDGSAEVLRVELLDTAHRRVELVEAGEPVCVRMRVRVRADVEAPVCGCLIRNRHGIHLYGTNTELQHVERGTVRSRAVGEG